jgi:hypothetical protein
MTVQSFFYLPNSTGMLRSGRRGSFVQLDNYNPKNLPIFSRDVLKRIASGDETWDQMVPPQVAEIIRQSGFFRYKKH